LKDRFKKEYLGRIIITFFGIFIILITLVITYFLFQKGVQTFTVLKYPILQFLTGINWTPQMLLSSPKGQVGSLVFIMGTLMVSGLALLIATPFAVISGLYIVEISPRIGKKYLQPAIEIFVGIPSVVYGWLGYTVLCPFIQQIFHMQFTGYSVLAAGIVLSVMIYPTIATVSADAFSSLPSSYRDASYALGSTRWQMLKNVNIPAATTGIFSGIVLGLARAFGEALAVSMVIGNSIAFPTNILSPTSTLTTVISINMQSSVDGTGWTDSLWTMALVLFLISFLCIVLIRIVSGRKKKV
jgi:phosphate transport system permease protein